MAEGAEVDGTGTTVRQTIRAWWREQLADAEGIDLPAATDRGALALRQDPDFRERFLDECLRPMVYEIGLALISRERGGAAPGTRKLSAKQIAARIEEDAERWSRWLEHDPTTGRHVPFLALTKEQAIAAAVERERRAGGDLRRAALLRLAAGRLEPGQAVGDVWTAEELAVMEERLVVGRPKVTLGRAERFLKGAAD